MKNRLLLILLLLVSGVCGGQIITTVAGGGTSGLGDGGSATSAVVKSPNGGAFDQYGNYYYVEVLEHRVRKIDKSGIITTVAGTGTNGFSGDGGLATASMLNTPASVICDSVGNIFIADGENHRIRKVDRLTGTIITVAGNGTSGYGGDGILATSTSLYHPNDICFDKAGNFYISDPDNYRIRKVNTSGIIFTYAGNGTPGTSGDGGLATAAQFFFPRGIAIDKSGNLYIADWSGNKVRKITSSGIISTIVGTGVGGYNGDNLPATAAQVSPVNLAIDKDDVLFITDYYNHVVRMIGPDGVIHSVVGNGTAGYSGDGGSASLAKLNGPSSVTIDTCGNIFITDINNQRIRKITYPKCHYLETENIPKASPQLSIYPLPTNDLLHINNLQTPATYKLLNMPGAVLQQGALKAGDNSISIEALPVGMYMLEVVNAAVGLREVRKVVKQ